MYCIELPLQSTNQNYHVTLLLYNFVNLMLLTSSSSLGHSYQLSPSSYSSRSSSSSSSSTSSSSSPSASSSSTSTINDNNSNQQKCPEGPPSQWESQLDAASKAYLAPIVFNGYLISLSEDYGGKIAATFRVRKSIKNNGSPYGTVPVNLISGSQVTLYFVRTKQGKSIPPYCPVHLNETSIGQLRPGQRYIVFASSPLTSLVDLQRQQFAESECVLRTSPQSLSTSQSPSTSSVSSSSSSSTSSSLCINYLTAFTSPELHNKRSARAVRKIISNPDWARAPEVKGLNGDLRIQSKSKLRLKCKVNGNPSPWIKWFKNGKRLKSKGRISIRPLRRDNSLLEIKPVLPVDTGYYECRAMNVIAREPSVGKVRVIVSSLNQNGTISSSTASTSTSAHSNLNKDPSTPQPSPPSSSHSSSIFSSSSSPSQSPKLTQSSSLPSSSLASTTTTIASDPSSPWHAKGRPCPHNAYCLNGGTCTFYESVGEYACHCAEGFMGLRCNFKNASVKGRNID